MWLGSSREASHGESWGCYTTELRNFAIAEGEACAPNDSSISKSQANGASGHDCTCNAHVIWHRQLLIAPADCSWKLPVGWQGRSYSRIFEGHNASAGFSSPQSDEPLQAALWSIWSKRMLQVPHHQDALPSTRRIAPLPFEAPRTGSQSPYRILQIDDDRCVSSAHLCPRHSGIECSQRGHGNDKAALHCSISSAPAPTP